MRSIGESLVNAMQMASRAGPAEAAELVAGECVVHAETKDHLNWELMELAAEKADKATAEVLRAAVEEVEEEEDEHLYHSTGWTRELWLQSLGIKAVLPPPEEQKNVTTAIGAERAKNARERDGQPMSATKRETIAPNGDTRYIRRDDKGRIDESVDVALAVSGRRAEAKTASRPVQGDKGDRKPRSRIVERRSRRCRTKISPTESPNC